MKPKFKKSIVGVFCEDIRMETAGTVTLVGLYPDNIAVVQTPALMPKLGIYVRGNFPIEQPPEAFALRLDFPWEQSSVKLGSVEPEKIATEVNSARQNGSDSIGLLVYAIFAPFSIQQLGRIHATISLGKEEWRVGSLNFVLSKPPASEPATVKPTPQVAPSKPATRGKAKQRKPSRKKKR